MDRALFSGIAGRFMLHRPGEWNKRMSIYFMKAPTTTKQKVKRTQGDDVCEIQCVNEPDVQAALAAMPDDAVVLSLAETFRTLADPTRLRMIAALRERELCVCDLASMLKLTGSAVSHQLRILRCQRLVRYRKEGKIAYYSLDDAHVQTLISQGIQHISE